MKTIKCVHPVMRYGCMTPCGKCFWCKNRRAEDWIIRLNEEYQEYTSSLFVTLTYDDEHLRFSPEGFPIIYKPDVQLYFRYLRRKGYKFKYFLVSEYGPTTLRPHYHLILFGVSVDAYQDLLACWDKGYISVYPVKGGSINYVSRYSLIHSELPSYLLEKPYKPFMLCSKGIGRTYSDDLDNVNYHRYTLDTTYNLNSYHKPLPRYYRDKIFEDSIKTQLTDNWRKTSFDYNYQNKQQYKYDFKNYEKELKAHKERYNRYRDKVLREFTKKAKI